MGIRPTFSENTRKLAEKLVWDVQMDGTWIARCCLHWQHSSDEQGCQWHRSSPAGSHATAFTALCSGCSSSHEVTWTSLTKPENSLDISVDKAHHKNMVSEAWQLAKQNMKKNRGKDIFSVCNVWFLSTLISRACN